MPTYEIDLPDGRSFEIDAPNEAALNLTVRSLMQRAPAPRSLVDQIPGNEMAPRQTRKDPSFADRVVGAGEAVLSMATGATTGAVGQVGGFLGGLAGAIRTGEYGTDQGARRVQQVTNNAAARLTYEPRTEQGRSQTAVVSNALAQTAPLMPVASELAATLGNAGRYGSAVVSPKLRRAVSGARQQAERARINARTEPSISNPSVRVPPEVAAAERAQAFATDRLGTPLSDLPAAIRAQIETVARDAKALEALDPAAIRRQAALAGLPVPVPATRGQLTRNLAQIKREENIRATDLGEPLMDVMARQDEALAGNLDVLRGRAQATTPQQYGRSVRGALTAKQDALKARADDLYIQAREQGGLAAPVEVTALEQWLKTPANDANAGWIRGRLDTYRGAKEGPISINDLEILRSEASAASREPGRAGHFAGKAVEVIDVILDGADGPYRPARAAWRAMKQEFTNQSLIDRLTNKKRGSLDRRVALEDTIDTVLRGSAEQIASLRHSLLTGGTAKTRMQGLQAWRDVRGGVINRLRERAMGSKGDGTENTAGGSQFNGKAFIDQFDTLDADGMLAEMFTTKELRQLRALRTAVETTRVMPSGRFTGSDSAPRLMALLEKFGNNLPIGNIGRGILQEAVKLQEQGRAARQAQQAVVPPLTEAAARIKPRKKPPKR